MSGRSRYVVRDVMTPRVIAVSADARFREIVTALRRSRVTAVPVVDDRNRVLGVVSEADLLPKEELRDQDPALLDQRQRREDYAKAGAVSAADLMTSPAVTIGPGATLSRAARVMAVHVVKRLPVVDGAGAITGIVSRGDLLKVFLRPDDDIAVEVRREVVDQLFPLTRDHVHVVVDGGVVTLTGTVGDTSLVPLAERLVRAVEGVVDVHADLRDATAAVGGPSP